MLLPTVSTALITLATITMLFVINWLVWASGVFAGQDTERNALRENHNPSFPTASDGADNGGFKHVA